MLGWRYRQITFFFGKVLLSLMFWEIIAPRIGLRKWSEATRSVRLRKTAAQFRNMAVRMGGVMIKVGQFLSSRVDVLPREIIDELSGLQDEVPAEAFEDVRKVAETEFGMSLEEKYAWFDEMPLAAASLGQAHLARIQKQVSDEGENQKQDSESTDWNDTLDLVVKIQRPDIEQIIAIDLAALRTVGKWINYYSPIRKRMNVPSLVEEFTRTLYEEIDYLAEGRNAETFAANFEGQAGVLVPKVIWTHTTRRVLTLENVTGIKISDYDAIIRAGIERGEVATRLLDTYLQQIFKDGFFHADPHPGNLFVRVCETEKEYDDHRPDWQLTFVDFGMVGRIPPKVRAGIRELLIGVGLRDSGRVVKSYQMLGVLLPGADLERIEQAGEIMFDQFWGKNMTELTQVDFHDMEAYAREFGDLIYTLPFQVPQDIIFLVRAVGILSGMCTGLDPNFNVWGHLAPFSQKLMAEEILGQPKDWLNEIGGVARKIIAFPGRVDSLLDKLERGKLVVQNPDLSKEIRRLEAVIGRLSVTLISISLLLAAVWLYLGEEIGLAVVFMASALAAWVFSIFRRR